MCRNNNRTDELNEKMLACGEIENISLNLEKTGREVTIRLIRPESLIKNQELDTGEELQKVEILRSPK
jgi:hypothetical protein